jgi:hypothetical protein
MQLSGLCTSLQVTMQANCVPRQKQNLVHVITEIKSLLSKISVINGSESLTTGLCTKGTTCHHPLEGNLAKYTWLLSELKGHSLH